MMGEKKIGLLLLAVMAASMLVLMLGLTAWAGQDGQDETTQGQSISEFAAEPLFEPAVDYETVPRISGCQEEPVRVVKYHGCRESKALYEKALARAKSQNTPLMVIFGFNKCPYCIVLERSIFDTSNPVRGVHVARYFAKPALAQYLKQRAPIKIPVLRLHARSEHGLKLADELGITEMAKERGWHRVWSPFVVFIDPVSGKMTSQSKWEAEEIYCDWAMNVAVSLEQIGLLPSGEPYQPRRRCKKS